MRPLAFMGVFQFWMAVDIAVLVPSTMTAPVSPFHPESLLSAFQTMGLDLPSVVVTLGDPRGPCVGHQTVVAAIWLCVIFSTTRLPPWSCGQLLPLPPTMWKAT